MFACLFLVARFLDSRRAVLSQLPCFVIWIPVDPARPKARNRHTVANWGFFYRASLCFLRPTWVIFGILALLKIRTRSTMTSDRVCNFGESSPLDFFIFSPLDFCSLSICWVLCVWWRKWPPHLENIALFPGGAKCVRSCHVSGCHGFLVLKKGREFWRVLTQNCTFLLLSWCLSTEVIV